MGSDASPKKWTLKEQREIYLKWFSLADDGSTRDSPVEFSYDFADGRC
jgi:hypothetical protein